MTRERSVDCHSNNKASSFLIDFAVRDYNRLGGSVWVLPNAHPGAPELRPLFPRPKRLHDVLPRSMPMVECTAWLCSVLT